MLAPTLPAPPRAATRPAITPAAPAAHPTRTPALPRPRPGRPAGAAPAWLIQLGLILALGAAGGAVYALAPGVRDQVGLALHILAQGDVGALRAYILSFGAWAAVASFALILLQAVVAPLPGYVVTFANGLAFGPFWGGLLSLVSTTVSAGLCFLIARVLGRGPVERLVGRDALARIDGWFARWGTHAVLVARLAPFLPVDVVSYAAGLTRMRPTTFLLATAAGLVPSMFLYAYLGQQAPASILVVVAANGVIFTAAAALALVRRARRR